MKSRSVVTVLMLVTAVPILFVSAAGLSTEVTFFSVRALLGMILIQGGILAGIALGATGTFYARRTLVMVGAGFLFAESIPFLVDGLFVFTLLPATVSLILLKVKSTKTDLVFSPS